MSNLFFTNDTLKNYTTNVIDTTLSKVTNPNLLINADFSYSNNTGTNIVDQKRGSDYSNTGGYSMGYDGWGISSCRMIRSAYDGMSFISSVNGGYASQKIEFPRKFLGKVVTVSAVVSINGGNSPKTVISNTGQLPSTFPSTNFTIDAIYPGGGNVHVMLGPDGVLSVLIVPPYPGGWYVYQVKLEIGTQCTIEDDSPQDYGTELLKCMRRQLVVGNITPVSVMIGSMMISSRSQSCNVWIPTPVPMRGDSSINGVVTMIRGTISNLFASISTPPYVIAATSIVNPVCYSSTNGIQFEVSFGDDFNPNLINGPAYLNSGALLLIDYNL